jgi:hypothetical protein
LKYYRCDAAGNWVKGDWIPEKGERRTEMGIGSRSFLTPVLPQYLEIPVKKISYSVLYDMLSSKRVSG